MSAFIASVLAGLAIAAGIESLNGVPVTPIVGVPLIVLACGYHIARFSEVTR